MKRRSVHLVLALLFAASLIAVSFLPSVSKWIHDYHTAKLFAAAVLIWPVIALRAYVNDVNSRKTFQED